MENDSQVSFAYVQEDLSHCQVDVCRVEANGQLVYYTGIYQWKDKTFHTEPEQSAFDLNQHPSKL